MKRILALAYLGFMLFSLSSTAENAISINILGNEQEDARFYFLEFREEILNETKYKIHTERMRRHRFDNGIVGSNAQLFLFHGKDDETQPA